jgi:hypothetical protein
MNIRLWIIEKLIKDGDIIVWEHDNIHGTLGRVNMDAEFSSIKVLDGWSIGLKRSVRRFVPTTHGLRQK